MTHSFLEISNILMQFGGIVAVDNVSFNIKKNTISSLIGPNGAGKTTVFNCITGFYKPNKGSIKLFFQEELYLLEKIKDFKICKDARVARTFQNIRLFQGMTVLENLIIAQHNLLMSASYYSISGLLGLSSYKKIEKKSIEKAKMWLEKIGLFEVRNNLAKSLPYGDQKRLEIARALCTDPVLLCLDEPAAGLNPKESSSLSQLLIDIKNDFNTTILLIEHDMSVVMSISDQVIVLDHGIKIADGNPQEIKNDSKVISAYLGEELND